MKDICSYADRPFAFVARYVKVRPVAHAAIVTAVVAAVACSVGAQYGVKILVDTLSGGPNAGAHGAWRGFLLLIALIGADNFLWRIASWIASYTFVAVTGDLRRDLFRHLTGQAPSYFAERMPGTLTSRITATCAIRARISVATEAGTTRPPDGSVPSVRAFFSQPSS